MATKKTSSTTTPRSRTKKTAATPENGSATSTPVSTSGGAAVGLAREKTTTTTTATGSPNFYHPAELQERVRRRAYELFQKRGGQHGFDIEDWLKAEAELVQR